MRKVIAALGLVVALAIPAAALAATLNPGKFGDLIEYGDKCADGAYYHFVNNQTDPYEDEGIGGGRLSATFTPGGTQSGILPYAINQHVQHFSVYSMGALTAASTNLEGKLVLSDVSCK